MTSKLVHDYGVLGLVECPGDMLNKETQYLLVLLGRHTRSSSVICGVLDNRFHIWLFNIDMLASEYCHVCQGVVGWAIFDRHWSLATIFSTTFGIFVKRDLKEGRYVWLQTACAKPETVTTSRRSAAPHARSIRSPVILSGLIRATLRWAFVAKLMQLLVIRVACLLLSVLSLHSVTIWTLSTG